MIDFLKVNAFNLEVSPFRKLNGLKVWAKSNKNH
jgi:hypothetical protein